MTVSKKVLKIAKIAVYAALFVIAVVFLQRYGIAPLQEFCIKQNIPIVTNPI